MTSRMPGGYDKSRSTATERSRRRADAGIIECSLSAPDLVNRQFTAVAPNRLWVADATRIPCGEGVFWLAAVRDVFSRRIGWKTSNRCDTDQLVNTRRIQTELGYLSLDEYETTWRAQTAPANLAPAATGGGAFLLTQVAGLVPGGG
jgi:transposase InsO family protein